MFARLAKHAQKHQHCCQKQQAFVVRETRPGKCADVCRDFSLNS